MWSRSPCTLGKIPLRQASILAIGKSMHVNVYHHYYHQHHRYRATCLSSPVSSCSSMLLTQRRNINLNIFSLFRNSEAEINIDRAKAVEEELPEIFVNEPVEVDDYIRPEQTFFEKLEDFWDWIVSFMKPVEKQVEIMRDLRQNGIFSFDLGGWGNVFFFYGLIMRLLMIIPNLYSNRNSLRLAQLQPQLSEITRNEQKVKNDRTLSSAEKKVIREGYHRLRKSIYRQSHCAQWKNLFPMLTAPITMSAFLSIRRLTMYETDLEMAPFLWIRDLSMPDPTYILPAICSFMFLINFELNARMQKGTRNATNIYIRWGMRAGSVLGVYFFASQPSAMFAYWIGLSLSGFLQPLLLRWQPFRTFFAFPDPPQAARAEIISPINGPSLCEKLFASAEEKARREKKRQEQRNAMTAKKYEVIDEYEIIFDTNAKKEEEV